jgi:hypothetical protein
MDALIKKAWELDQLIAGVPVETILTAAVWLEEKFRQKNDGKIALAVALHYLLLALRNDIDMESPLAQEYCQRAAEWQRMAAESGGVALPVKVAREN